MHTSCNYTTATIYTINILVEFSIYKQCKITSLIAVAINAEIPKSINIYHYPNPASTASTSCTKKSLFCYIKLFWLRAVSGVFMPKKRVFRVCVTIEVGTA